MPYAERLECCKMASDSGVYELLEPHIMLADWHQTCRDCDHLKDSDLKANFRKYSVRDARTRQVELEKSRCPWLPKTITQQLPLCVSRGPHAVFTPETATSSPIHSLDAAKTVWPPKSVSSDLPGKTESADVDLPSQRASESKANDGATKLTELESCKSSLQSSKEFEVASGSLSLELPAYEEKSNEQPALVGASVLPSLQETAQLNKVRRESMSDFLQIASCSKVFNGGAGGVERPSRAEIEESSHTVERTVAAVKEIDGAGYELVACEKEFFHEPIAGLNEWPLELPPVVRESEETREFTSTVSSGGVKEAQHRSAQQRKETGQSEPTDDGVGREKNTVSVTTESKVSKPTVDGGRPICFHLVKAEFQDGEGKKASVVCMYDFKDDEKECKHDVAWFNARSKRG